MSISMKFDPSHNNSNCLSLCFFNGEHVVSFVMNLDLMLLLVEAVRGTLELERFSSFTW